MLVLFFKILVIEEKSMVRGYVNFCNIIGFVNLMNEHFQFINGITATFSYLFGRCSMTFVINGVMHHIDKRMFKYLTILLLIIFTDHFIIHTNSPGTIGIHLFCSFRR